jgi:hypothetical protein
MTFLDICSLTDRVCGVTPPQHNIFRSFGRHHSNDLISIILLHLNTSNVNPDYLMYGEARNLREGWKTILFDHIEGYFRRILLRHPDGLRFGDDPWNELSNCEVTIL